MKTSVVNDLAAKIEKKWQKHNFCSEAFCDLVWSLTQNDTFADLSSISAQLEYIEHQGVRDIQMSSTFSDMFIQIFKNDRFTIEILNWRGGHVNIHDHDFSGVQFQLAGDSLNILYDFEEGQRLGAIQFGRLKVRNAKIWKEGSRSIVRAGSVDPHSVSHIGKPTTSLLVRTLPTKRFGAQSNYFPDCKAQYTISTPLFRKKLTGLTLLSKSEPKEFEKVIRSYIDKQSLSENLFMLEKLAPILFSQNYSSLVESLSNSSTGIDSILGDILFTHLSKQLKKVANTRDLSWQERTLLFALASVPNDSDMKKTILEINQSADSHLDISQLDSIRAKLTDRESQIINSARKLQCTR